MRNLRIKELKNQEIKPPALIIVGKTIDLYKPDIKELYLYTGTHAELYQSEDLCCW